MKITEDQDKEIIGIIGAGQMGRGIAEVFASNGYKTLLFDINQKLLKSSFDKIVQNQQKLVEKEKISSKQSKETINNLLLISNLEDFSSCTLVIEAIIENFEIKKNLFQKLQEIVNNNCILGTNTSSISITRLAGATDIPERVIGIHFMNPAPIMLLVEVIKGLKTSNETYRKAISYCENIGKTHVTAKKDYPGFIVNRILVPMINEAFFTLMDSIASPEEIDIAMKLGTNQPMGPLLLADFVGLDTVLSICKIFHEEFGEDKYRPCPLLVKYVEAGLLGVKTGEGVFKHNK